MEVEWKCIVMAFVDSSKAGLGGSRLGLSPWVHLYKIGEVALGWSSLQLPGFYVQYLILF